MLCRIKSAQWMWLTRGQMAWSAQDHPSLGIGELLRLVHDDVAERTREAGPDGRRVLVGRWVAQSVLEVGVAEYWERPSGSGSSGRPSDGDSLAAPRVASPRSAAVAVCTLCSPTDGSTSAM